MQTILRAPTRWVRERPEPPRDAERRLTRTEQDNVRHLAHALRLRLGSRAALALAMRTTPEALRKATNGRRRVTMRLAGMVAFAADMTVQAVLRGEPLPGRCPLCGRE